MDPLAIYATGCVWKLVFVVAIVKTTQGQATIMLVVNVVIVSILVYLFISFIALHNESFCYVHLQFFV